MYVRSITYAPRLSRLSLSISSCNAFSVSSCCCCRNRIACSRWWMRCRLVVELDADAASSVAQLSLSHAVVARCDIFWDTEVSGRRGSRSFINGRGGHDLERVLTRLHCGRVLSGGNSGPLRLSTLRSGTDCFSMPAVQSQQYNEHQPHETYKSTKHTLNNLLMPYQHWNELTYAGIIILKI